MHFTAGIGRGEDTFRITGFRDWKHAIGKKGVISVHDAVLLTSRQCPPGVNTTPSAIADRLNSARAQLIESNHHYIKTIAEVILLCAKQKLALRGHKESSKSQTRATL